MKSGLKIGNQLWRSVRYRPWLAGGILVLSQLVCVACWHAFPHIYKAEALVLIDPSPGPAQLSGNDVQANMQATKVALLKSRFVVDRVVARMGARNDQVLRANWEALDEDGRPSFDDWLAAVVSSSLVPSIEVTSYLLHVGYASPVPDIGASMANLFAAELVRVSDILNSGIDRFADRTFELSQERLRKELMDAQKAVLAKSGQDVQLGGFFSDPAMRDYLRTSSLSSRTATAYLAGQAGNAALGATADVGSLLDDGFVQGQRQRLAELVAQRAEVATTMGESNPVLKGLDASIRSVEATLRAHERTRRAVNQVGVKMSGEMASTLSKQEAEQKQAVLARNGQLMSIDSGNQSVDALAERYEDALAQHMLIALNLDLPRTDVRVITEASSPTEPWFPSWKYYFPICFALGLVNAVIGAHVAERRDRRVRNIGDVEAAVGAQVVGRMG